MCYPYLNAHAAELSILRLLGLFDRTADEESLTALRKPPATPDLTGVLVAVLQQALAAAASESAIEP